MLTRYSCLALVFVAAVAIPSRLATSAPAPLLATSAPAPLPATSAPVPLPATSAPAPLLTDAAATPWSRLDAAEQRRWLRASRILGEYLPVVTDPSPSRAFGSDVRVGGVGGIGVGGGLAGPGGVGPVGVGRSGRVGLDGAGRVGRSGWCTVTRMLEGRDWLDRAGAAAGWRALGLSRVGPVWLLDGAEALDPYLHAGGPGGREAGVEYLKRGLALGAAGQTAVAVVSLDRAAEALPWMADWAQYFVAEVLAPSGDTAEVRRRLERAGPGLVAARGWRLRVRAARQARDLPQARQIALDAARSSAPAATRAAAWTLLGDLRVEGGDTGRAREAYRSAMQGAPSSVAAVDAARGLTRLGPTPYEWRMIASVYHRHGNQARAIAGFEAFLASGAGSPEERAQARLQLGQALFADGRHAAAERALLALADQPVPARIAAEALHQAGRAQHRQGKTAEARRTLDRVAQRFPDQDGAARALYLLADLQHDDLDMAAARRNYRRAAAAAPTVHEAGLALIRLGGLEYLDGDYEAAAAVFEEYRRSHPRGRHAQQADYWAARSYLALGREADAQPILRQLRAGDPLSYYGIRAGQLLGQAALAVPLEASPPRRERTDSLVQLGLRRVEVLEELGRRSDALQEVNRLRLHFARQDGGDYALAEALTRRGYMLTGIGMGWDIRSREAGWNPRLLRIVYPFPYRELVLPEAGRGGVDPFLVAAVIRRESAFDPRVTSSAGAIGLMQIMPRTGQGLAREVGLARYDPRLLEQPELNVALGVRYLSSLLRQYDGNLALALAAYNAGPGRANRWRNFPEAREPELLMERIPFPETREYVRHVKMHVALYRELYPLEGG